ncbi:MAG: flagellar biosynthetic protein FliR, partial [Rhodospirillales bacterium]
MLEELVKLNIFGFLLILSRVGAMMSILPGIAAAYVSMRIRIVLSVLVALVMTPVLTETLPAPPVSPYVLFL